MRYINKIVCALACVACVACTSQKRSQIERPAFSSDSAYAYVEKQMSFGPRVPNGQGHTDCALYLIQQLRSFGAEVELQKGMMTDYSGRPQQVMNIIGHLRPDSKGKTILLCAHYDTRPWCDEEEEYDRRFLNVPGANDGASGVAVLLEVARQIALADSVANATASPVDIIFFDCEDMGTPSFFTGAERENTWCLGSQLWASLLTPSIAHQYQYGILLDMVGAPDAMFMREAYSVYYADNYLEQVWRSASDLGYGKFFSNQQGFPITDDHYYINTLTGIPCIDIIHHNTVSGAGFPAWWHTRNDDITNISRTTLQAVGEVVMATIAK
ncbi:MAG: M28 family peptidase [Paludibacteraceae bacterium]|nr:M28 family peptidase [Paludibacteraceae bacterium]